MGKVFVIGDLNVDGLLYINDLPKRGEEMHANKINFSVGGNAANFAFALSTMGITTEFHSAIGSDHSRKLLIQTLEESGVELKLKEIPGPNGYTCVMVEPGGERTLMSNKGACLSLRVNDLEPILERIRPGDIVYTGGLFHLPKLTHGYQGFLKNARVKGATTMMDYTFDSRHCADCFPDLAKHLDMVFLNEAETKRLGKGNLDSSMKRISDMGVKNVIVKLGSRGSMFYVNGKITKKPGIEIKPVDTCGSGDVFNAGFVMGFISGLTPEQCLGLGNMAGAHNARFSGLKAPPKEEAISYVRKHKQ